MMKRWVQHGGEIAHLEIRAIHPPSTTQKVTNHAVKGAPWNYLLEGWQPLGPDDAVFGTEAEALAAAIAFSQQRIERKRSDIALLTAQQHKLEARLKVIQEGATT